MARCTGSSVSVDIQPCPIVVSTSNADWKFVLYKPFFLVGSVSSNGLSYCINDESVSPRHCVFIYKDKTWKLHDLSSSGTFVNRIKMLPNQKRILMDRDVIQFGYMPINTYMFYADRRDYEKTVEFANIELIWLKDKMACLEADLSEKNLMIESLKTNAKTLEAKIDGGKKNSEEYVASISHIIETELRCSMCCELLCEAVSLSCGHMICKLCFEGWKQNAERAELCPFCGEYIESDVTAYAVNSMLSAVIPKLSEDVKAARYKVLLDRGSNISDLDQLKPLTEEDSELPIVAAQNDPGFAAPAAFVE